MRSRVLAGLIAVGALLAAGAALAQQVVENPDKPLSKNAGRVVVPKEVMAISDEGARDYYFKWPHNLKVAADGSIFLMDDAQLLWFDKNGRFVRNLQKKGQGPGEIQRLGDFVITEKDFAALARAPDRLVWLDHSGKFERETPLRKGQENIYFILHFRNGTFYLHTQDIARFQGEPRFIEVNQNIKIASEKTPDLALRISFPTKAFVASVGGASGIYHMTGLIASAYGTKFLALSHTAEYLLKLYDLEANTVIRQFRRVYKRVDQPPQTEKERGTVILNGKPLVRPQEKYKNDIADILVHNGDIWAVTSTRDKNKGVLVDVFNEKGVYADCFYLKLPEAALKSIGTPTTCAIQGDFLYIIENNEDGTFVIKKYQLGA